MGQNIGVLLFQNDLRIHDNPSLNRALKNHEQVFGLYRLNPALLGTHPIGGWIRQGHLQAANRAQALISLQQNLNQIGIPLFLVSSRDSKRICEAVGTLRARTVYMAKEYTTEEVEFAHALKTELAEKNISLKVDETKTLYAWADIENETGLSISSLPHVFTSFRKKINRVSFQAPQSTPSTQSTSSSIHPSPLSSAHSSALRALEDLPKPLRDESDELWNRIQSTARVRFHDQWDGSEDSALKHLQQYIWESHAVGHYKETRNALDGFNQSSRLSHWLATGALSPRFVASEVSRYEQTLASGSEFESTEWLIFELLWRDFFIFRAGQIGSELFRGSRRFSSAPSQHQFSKYQLSEDSSSMPRSESEALQRWINGTTGAPLIDACMRELLATGYMSNRGRQNVASFWSKHWKQDWRLGASYFESQLYDYDAAVNWGNWAYVSGQGNDPRDRKFDFERQSRMYDPNGDFIRRWIPELRDFSADEIHKQQ